ncbi:MAG: nucleotide exchange factor GrpE [Deltaproteobacteria bacterium]|jgi:molecular chaperone GrpE|nr:nucleotide exchange factor GrpE [Deltaproteobacteria bacterium]
MAHKPHDKYKLAAELGDLLPEPPASAPEEEHAPVPENLDMLCRLHVCPSCAVQAEAEDVRLRAIAEVENVKKRLKREQEEYVRFAAEGVLGDLLPSLDSLDRAIEYGSLHEACKEMVQGVEMTRKLLLDAVKAHGLASCGERGEAFTPEFHEAVGFDKRNDLDEGLVSVVVQRGYLLKDRLLRPAKVLVNKKTD